MSTKLKCSATWQALGWIFAVLFGLLTISMLLLNNWLHALVLFLVVFLCLPPVSSFIRNASTSMIGCIGQSLIKISQQVLGIFNTY